MQKELNQKFYLTIQQELRSLILKSNRLSYGEILDEFNIIKDRVYWSNWGMQGNLTKMALIEYLEVLHIKINKKNIGFKIWAIYLLDKEVKDSRRKLHERYNMDFKE